MTSTMGGKLVGGLYGVSLGRMFYGESMFSLATDASKIAFAHLVKQLERRGFGMIDWPSPSRAWRELWPSLLEFLL